MIGGHISYEMCIIEEKGEKMSIDKALLNYDKAQVVIDGKVYNIDNYGLNLELNKLLVDCHVIPAFGVSIHQETIKVISKGVWLKLKYNNTQSVDDMSFDELLIEVDPEFMGFNIIRGNSGRYEGRCYYINLIQNNMSKLYNYLKEIN